MITSALIVMRENSTINGINGLKYTINDIKMEWLKTSNVTN